MGQVEGRTFAGLAHKARARGLDARERFRAFSPEKPGAQYKDSGHTRWVLTWKEVDGEKTVKARTADRGYQDPDLRLGNVDIAGRASRRFSYLQLISLGGPNDTAAMGPGYQECIPSGGRIRSGSLSSRFARAEFQGYSPRMEIAATSVWVG